MSRRLDWWLGILLITGALVGHAAIPRYEYRNIIVDGSNPLTVVNVAPEAERRLRQLLSDDVDLRALPREKLESLYQQAQALRRQLDQGPQVVTVQLQIDRWTSSARIVLVDQHGWRFLP